MIAQFAMTLFGVSLTDGRILWHRPFNLGGNPPVMVDGRVYAWTWAKSNAH